MLKCCDCELPYNEFGVDLVLPDQVWKILSNGDNILCANCICKRLKHYQYHVCKTTALMAWPDCFDYSGGTKYDIKNS